MAIVMLLAPVLLVVALGRATVTRRDVAWIAEPLPTDSHEAIVLTRYLERHRSHRLVGAMLGAALAIIVGIRLYSEVTIGIGQNGPLGDVLFCGLAGSVLGTLSAETFRLSEPKSTAVMASLRERDPLGHRHLVDAARVLVGVTTVVGVIVALAQSDAAPALVALAGVVLAAVAEATRRAITGRRRPVLSDRAIAVDGRMRWFANGAVSHLQLAAALLVLGWLVSAAGDPDNTAVGVVQAVFVISCLVAAIVFLRRAAPRPPRGWSPA